MKKKKSTTKIILVCILGALCFIAGIALTEKCYSYVSQNYCVDLPENVLCSPNYGLCMMPLIIAMFLIAVLVLVVIT